jgi:glycine betaine/proline transport system ATP-binding protein
MAVGELHGVEAAPKTASAPQGRPAGSPERPEKIVLRNVFKIFGGQTDRAVALIEAGADKDAVQSETGCIVGVNDANFEIREGEIFVVMGLSGSGKSTLLRLLNRLIEPTLGAILIDGQDVTRMSKRDLIELRRRDMSMVFQSFALLPNRTVIENAAFGMEVAGVGAAERRRKALAALAAVRLDRYADSRPDELSGGMKQRVGLARALASEPTILLMDEAFSALDPLIRTEMQDELLRLQAEHSRTIVFVSHDLDEAMRIGDRIAIMQDGVVVQVGTPEQIVSHPANDYVRSFFRGVDVTRVFRAGNIADDGLAMIEQPGLDADAALERMRAQGRDIAALVSPDGRYQGMVAAGGPDSPRGALLGGIKPIEADTPLSQVIGRVAESRWPLPVVDAEGRYLGAISKSSLLMALNRAG